MVRTLSVAAFAALTFVLSSVISASPAVNLKHLARCKFFWDILLRNFHFYVQRTQVAGSLMRTMIKFRLYFIMEAMPEVPFNLAFIH